MIGWKVGRLEGRLGGRLEVGSWTGWTVGRLEGRLGGRLMKVEMSIGRKVD